MKNLIDAVNKVMEAVESVDKGLTVGTGRFSYKGVSDKDVKIAFNRAMRTTGLAMFPTKIEPTTRVERWQEGDKWRQSIFTEVITTYTLYHTSGQSVELQGYGHGVDPQDKAAGKATTYAMKYALLYTFITATGAIDDADTTHSDEVAAPAAPAPKTGKDILTITHPNWDKCVKHLRAAGSIKDLEKKYSITDDVKEKLIAQTLA
tara:strand:- start:210 stop:824 length:615 start_codon:yes stop_codon:yes gene_type:complete